MINIHISYYRDKKIYYLYAASINIYGSQNQINSCRLYYLNDSNEITNDIIS